MNTKPRLHLKPISAKNRDTLKIYGTVKQAIENLHHYLDDFFETRNILIENQEKTKNKNKGEPEEIEKHLQQIDKKIIEITEAMRNIASEMPLFVKFEN